MNTCDTCKWWGGLSDEPPMRKCKKQDWGEDSVYIANAEPYGGGEVVTGPKFGCIHHEPK